MSFDNLQQHRKPIRSTVARKKERERHAELEGPVTLTIDVETLWRPITKTKLPITVRQHYYA